ncbi:putative secreted protein [Litoreibacter ponti]|uniref:Putative secreted protein n=1 Tax=Litoreibacter ponti TaxID=1510457 RepID=A0A2T6BF13_9RHOB|nr:VPLPA-CTERM sorting domain-containing protein [Litoreibacter ponti]PTX54637.1 putative secreted protein [Litoreibacter ponti]
MKTILTICVAFLGLSISAQAATISNSVSIINGGGGTGRCGSTAPQSTSSNSDVAVTLNDGGVNCTVAGDSVAGGGVIAYRATATFDRSLGPAGSVRIQGGARSVMSDIFLTPLFDVDDPDIPFNTDFTIDLQLNASLEGTATGAVANDTGQAGGGAGITATVSLSGSPSPGNFSSNSAVVRGGAGADWVNLLSDYDDFSSAMMPLIRHDWRQPFSVIFNMDTNTSASAFGANQATGTLDAFNSLSFSKVGPAFILPDGFTVNAPELNIVDNRWIDPRIPEVAPVPLPAGLPLLLAGLGALGFVLRRKTQTDQEATMLAHAK